MVKWAILIAGHQILLLRPTCGWSVVIKVKVIPDSNIFTDFKVWIIEKQLYNVKVMSRTFLSQIVFGFQEASSGPTEYILVNFVSYYYLHKYDMCMP